MKIKWVRAGALVLIVLGSLYASVQNLVSTRELGSISDDPVADWEKRFEPLKKQLPFVRGVVGYISDSSIPGVSFDSANDQGEYVLAQYVLAPLVIVKGADQEWNIGNLGRTAYEVWSRSNHGEFEVTEFQGGLYLLHRIRR
jgi:hypothetical protein